MPTIINPYSGNQSVADSLKSLGDSMFGHQSQQALIREQALKLQRNNQAAPLEAQSFRDNNPTEMGAQAILGDRPANDYSQYYRTRAAIAANGNPDDKNLNTAMLANGPVSATPVGQGRELANAQAVAQIPVTERAQEFKNTPTQVSGPNGLPVLVRQSDAIGQNAPLNPNAVEAAAAARDTGMLPNAGPQAPGALPRPMGSPIGIPPTPPGVNGIEARHEAGKNISDENKTATEQALGAIDFLRASDNAKRTLQPMPNSVFGPWAGPINTVRSVAGAIPGDPMNVHPAMGDYATKQGLLNDLATSKFREKFGARPTQMEYAKMLEMVGGLNTPDAAHAVAQLGEYEKGSYANLQNAVARGLIKPENVEPAIIQRGIASGALDPRYFGGGAQQPQGGTPQPTPAAGAPPQNAGRIKIDANGNIIR